MTPIILEDFVVDSNVVTDNEDVVQDSNVVTDNEDVVQDLNMVTDFVEDLNIVKDNDEDIFEGFSDQGYALSASSSSGSG